MLYRLLADLCVLFHFLWILFIVFGIVFALKGSRLAWLHLGGLLFSLLLNILGWYCPLTYLENYMLMSCGAGGTYAGSFIIRYLTPIIYPDMPEMVIRIGGVFFVFLNLVVYGFIVKRYLRGGNPFA
jgi:hypothetical protein